MDAQAALAWVDTLVFTKTGERLSALQSRILQQVWQGRKYLEIAEDYGYTEGHVKDVGSQLWKLLSRELGEKINKINCRAVLERYLHTLDVTNATFTPIALEDSNFVGRKAAIAHLNTLVSQGSKFIVIQGEGGLGKTTLAQQYLQTQNFDLVLELLMAKETQNITSAERVVEEWLKQDLNEEPGVEFGVTLGRLKRQLQTRRIGVLIDNLEPALDRHGQLLAPYRSYVELFRILADARVQSVSLITSRDRLCEPSIQVEHYRLPGLDLKAWQQYFSSRGLPSDSSSLRMMHRAYGGNAKAMGILCGAIKQDFEGDVCAYWREHHGDLLVKTDLKNLVVSQVNRLQVIDFQAYRLFCRLGCYRYQDVPKIPAQGLLCLLWDIPTSQQRQVIASLQNRSLVECYKGEYWLHPAIQAEAIARLRDSDECESVNHKAAEFWTQSIQSIETTQDALQAMEAYYHYIEINDFESACRVILKSRNNQWRQFLPLGSTLWRMGLLQPVLAAITQVIYNIKSELNLSELYNILGDLCWITGKIQKAIACQEKTLSLVTPILKSLVTLPENKHQIYYLQMLEVDSLLSIGLYKIDLWELEAAALLFQQVINLSKNTARYRWAEKATVCLALVNSYLGLQESYALSNSIYHSIFTQQLPEYTGKFAYFIQIIGQTYANLGDFEKANQMYCLALKFAEESYYTQVKAKTLKGLEEIHRQKEELESALDKHLEAIDLLKKIGAKCDLAEAYFQISLTYQKLQRSDESKINFDRAILLFTEMSAPKQVEKVLSCSTYHI